MQNKRQLIRLDVEDFLEIRPLNEKGEKCSGGSRNFSLMGICFTSEVEWRRGQILLIDYFISEEMDSVKLEMLVVWSELIDSKSGYFCGGQITMVEESKEEKFAAYYFKKLKERLC